MSEEQENIECPVQQFTNELITSDWKTIAKKYGGDFGEHTQAELKKEFKLCESSAYFGLCIKNAVAMNPVLNRSKVVRSEINQFHF